MPSPRVKPETTIDTLHPSLHPQLPPAPGGCSRGSMTPQPQLLAIPAFDLLELGQLLRAQRVGFATAQQQSLHLAEHTASFGQRLTGRGPRPKTLRIAR